MAFLVAVAGGDVHDRGEASAVFGAEAAGIDVGVEDDIGLEDGVESYGMEGVVDNHAVEQREVLYHGAAADVELSALVAGGVDAGQHLQVLCQVGLSADGGHLLYLRGGDFLDGHLCLHAAFLGAVACYHHVVEHGGGGLELDVESERLSFGEGDLFGVFLIADVAYAEQVGAVGYFGDDEESVEVGGGAVGGAVEHDVGEGYGLAGGVVVEHAFDGVLCCGGQGGGGQQEQEYGAGNLGHGEVVRGAVPVSG